MPEDQILKLTYHYITKRFKSIEDLPEELGNTLANIYYHDIEIGIKTLKEFNSDHPFFNQEDTDYDKKLDMLKSAKPDTLNNIKTINRMIDSYREIKAAEKPSASKFIAQLILDTMKYDIKDAPGKSELRRWFERIQKKKNVREIPNLFTIITLYNI